tara:strand:+ start:5454 stop:6068 length:615 start_codon:yes stop_codon:yes gene_type:complete
MRDDTMMLPTYSNELNQSLSGGVQGLFEIYGDEGVGKTGLCMSLFEHAVGMYIDMDGTFPHHMEHLMDRSNVNLIPGHNLSSEDVLTVVQTSANANCDLVVIDPVGVWDDWTISDVVGQLHRISMRSDMAIGIVNHSHYGGQSKGNISCSTYCHIRVEMRKSEQLLPDGMITDFEIRKNIYGLGAARGRICIDFLEEHYGQAAK